MSESGKKAFKIKVLPKSGKASTSTPPPPPRKKKSHRPQSSSTGSVIFAAVATLIVGAIFIFEPFQTSKPKDSVGAPSSQDTRVNRYLQDGQKRAELKEMEVDVENRALPKDELPAFLPLDGESAQKRPMGVELDSDPAMDKVYEDLYGDRPSASLQTPEERVSARIAEKKWVHRFEKEEKKTFIRNFIAAARDAGYEVELNEELVVTRVKPITNKPKIPLDKVIENMPIGH